MQDSQKLPQYSKAIGQRIHISWDDFHNHLKAIYNVAIKIEESLLPKKVKYIELNWLLQDIFDDDSSLTFEQARKIIINECNYDSVPEAKRLKACFADYNAFAKENFKY